MSTALSASSAPARFRLIRHLGSGGMGQVFEAVDLETGAHVALKTLHTESPEALLQLKNEFRFLQDVGHRNLVNLLELIEDSGRFFVAMEFVAGVDFLAYVRPGFSAPLAGGLSETRRLPAPTGEPASFSEADAPVPRARDVAPCDVLRLRAALGQLARGLCALHDFGKLHRDVKPANILVTPSGRVVLVDFGLATAFAPLSTHRAQHAVGTRAFMAPEQAAGQHVTPASDWFSVGVVLYLALTGELPFNGAEVERQRVRGDYRPISEACPDAPADLRALCDALLDLDPARRPNGSQVLHRLGLGRGRDGTARVPESTLFVGREEELARLQAAVLDSRDHAVTTLVVGDSGVGKSTLVREALGRFTTTETLVLSGRCYERELVPYKALDGIVDALSHFLLNLSSEQVQRLLPAHAAVLVRVFPVLGRVPSLARSEARVTSDPFELRGQAFSALRQLFSAIARSRPVLLYIDDLQWADADSHLLLSDLLSEPASPALCLVVTARPPAAGVPDRIAALTARLADVRQIALAPLALTDARRLAESVLGRAEQLDLAHAIAQESAGHPLFVVTLALYASSEGGLPLGALRLDDALWACVQSIPLAARRLLELVAVAGAPLSPALAKLAATADSESYSASTSALRTARLLRTTTDQDDARIEPYHDRVRETVLAHLTPSERRACHQRLADVLESSGRAEKDPQGLVRHLEGAGLVERAASQAQRAAARALETLAFDQAAELYRTALRLGTFQPGEVRALHLRLAEALTNAGRASEAARAYLVTAAGATPEDRLLYRRLAADHMLRSGHLEEGLEILSEVLSELGDVLPTQRQALFITLAYRLRLRFRGLGWQQRPASDVSPSTLQRIDAYHAVGVSLSLIDPIRGGSFEVRALRLALNAGEPRRLAAVLTMEAGYQGSVGARGLRAGRALIDEVDRIAATQNDPYLTAIPRMIEGLLSVHGGQFALAAAQLRHVQPLFRDQPGTYFEQAFCHCFWLICLRNRGQLGELQDGFFDWVRDAERRTDRFTEASLRFNLNNVWLARDEPDEALRDLARVNWVQPQGGYHVQHWYEQHAHAEVALYAGRGREGLAHFRSVLEQLSRSFIMRMRVHRSVAHWLLGRLILASFAGARAPVRALKELGRLADTLWREDTDFARTWSLLLAAGVAHQRAQPARARELLGSAIEHAERADLPHCAAAARFRLGQLDAAHCARAGLWFKAQRIRNPERMAEVWAPGFGERPSSAG
ncbi:MAG: protein kinase [Polyangiaceae bacterium]